MTTTVHTRFLSRVFFFSAVVLLPLSTFAAGVDDLFPGQTDQAVTRGEFIRASVKGMGMENLWPSQNLPYTRIPKALLPYVDAAYKKGALKVFGKDLALSRNITRGEVVQMLVVLKGAVSTKDANFTDVPKGTDLSKAVSVAIEKNWLKPASTDTFGTNKTLTNGEARALLKVVLGANLTIKPVSSKPVTPGSTVPTVRVEFTPAGSKTLKGNLIDSIWKVVQEDFYYEKNIKNDEAVYKAIEGMIQSLGDPYSSYLRPTQSLNFQSQIDGQVSGIGAQVEHVGGILTVVSPVRGSPAEKAGLQAGDQILAVDGQSLSGLGFVEAVEKVRGPKGSKAVLRIRRNGAEMDVTITRDVVKIPEVIITWQGNVAIVAITQFGKLTETELRGHMQKIQDQKPTGIVLDLRDNPGGLLTAADSVVSNFVAKGTKYAEIHFRGGTQDAKTTKDPTIDNSVPVVVLVNESSASASEIVAGALQDHKRAKIVGVKTFGKGTVQEVLQFEDKSSLKLTVAEWLTPNGRKIDKTGVEPDVVVAENGRDEPLLKALELLR